VKELYKHHPNAVWHRSDKSNTAPRRIFLAFILNTVFAIIEIIGGVLTGSVAIIADAVHDMGDSVSLGVAWYFEKIARNKEKDSVFSYGYGRLSLLSAAISGVVILSGMIYILIESFNRFFEPSVPNAEGMIYLSILGIVVNGFAAFKLSHGHTQNEKILTWHLLEDVLGWAAVLVGAALMKIFGWNWIDAVLAVLIAVYIGYNAMKNLNNTFRLILQSVPEGFDIDNFIDEVEKIEGVNKAHDLHVWSMDGQKHILSIHIIMQEGESAEKTNSIKEKIRETINKFGDFHATIEVESYTGSETANKL
jgi:cobalt-zinc-cadmium efflux system protein